jgi:antitoxin YefM
MKVINYSQLRLNLKKWLDLVTDNVEKVIITRKNQKDIVLISLDEYNSLVETNYLLSGKNREVLLESIEQLRSDQKVTKDLIEE